MNEMQVFKYKDNEVRTVEQGGEVWWVLADVCRVLALSEPHRVAHRLDEDEKGRTQITTLGGDQKMTIISESGLYKVILRSDKPEAKKFTRWVTHEVLPSIRKMGGYIHTAAQPQRSITVDDYLRAASIIANCRNERMPYVLGFLEQGGLSIPKLQEMNARSLALADGRHRRYAKTEEDVDAQAVACVIIKEAVEHHGFSLAQINRITGIPTARIGGYRKGKRPTPERARYIIDILSRYLPQEATAE